jgi:hypothetical protein
LLVTLARISAETAWNASSNEPRIWYTVTTMRSLVMRRVLLSARCLMAYFKLKTTANRPNNRDTAAMAKREGLHTAHLPTRDGLVWSRGHHPRHRHQPTASSSPETVTNVLIVVVILVIVVIIIILPPTHRPSHPWLNPMRQGSQRGP